MVTERKTILLTSADIDSIEKERMLVDAEIEALERKLPELQARRGELSERLSRIDALLNALGLNSINETSSNSLYAARNVQAVPRTNGHTA